MNKKEDLLTEFFEFYTAPAFGRVQRAKSISRYLNYSGNAET